MNNTNRNRSFITVILIVLISIALFGLYGQGPEKPRDSTISEIAALVKEGKVIQINVDKNQIIAKLDSKNTLKAFKEPGVGIHEYGITPDLVPIEVKDPSSGEVIATVLSFLLPFILIGLILWFMLRQLQSGNMRALSFGKSQARLYSGGKKRITFEDIAGAEEAKQELMEIVEFLKYPAKFRAIGAEIPKGILLVGAPGVGKTLLAKAVAGEAGVPFFSLSASEFVEMFVGVGAARVRDLFAKAKRNAPALIFVDELDAIGRQRGSGLGGSHDEREQTLNQILVEMDGFETDDKVIVMSATNRPDVLDPALLRPGRFDRRVVMELPDRNERIKILELHSRNKPLEDVDFGKVASATAGGSGADLKNIINEAAILAARNNQKKVTQADLDNAVEKVLIGPERRSKLMSEKEKEIAAFHEVGHALVGHLLPNTDPIHKISLVSRGAALGYTWSLPEEDKRLIPKSKFQDEMAQLLGGREAEKLIFNEITTGAENDLEKATKIARDMVKVYGMSEKLGPIKFGHRDEMIFLGRELHEGRNYSDQLAFQIDEEVKRIIQEAETTASKLLIKHKKTIEKISKALIKQETIERAEFEKLVGTSKPKV